MKIFASVLFAAILAWSTPAAGQFTGTTPQLRLYETDQTLPAGLYRVLISGDTLTVARNTASAGNFSTETTHLSLTATTFTINDDSANLDFRIESDANANAVVLDAGISSGEGAMAFGQAPAGRFKYRFTGNITSDGGSDLAEYFSIAPNLTAHSGDTNYLTLLGVDGSTITPAASFTVGTISTLRLDEPGITLGSGSAATNVVTLYIVAAPTEGTNDYAFWIDDGLSRFDGEINMNATGVAHGVTDVVPTDTYGALSSAAGVNGGLYIQGISDQTATTSRGLVLRGITNDGIDDSVAHVELIGANRNGTTIAAIANAETVMTISNHSTKMVSYMGNGNVHYVNSTVAHGVTDIFPTDVYGAVGIVATNGGFGIQGLSDQDANNLRPFVIRGITNVTVDDDIPHLELIAANRDGTGIAAIAAAETVLTMSNNSTKLLSLLGNGTLQPEADNSYDLGATSKRFKTGYFGTLFFVGDTANANMTQGITINQGAADDLIFTLKSSDIATGLTTGTSGPNIETDDILAWSKNSGTLGGLRFKVFGEDAALDSTLVFQVYGGTARTGKDTSEEGLVNFLISEHNGSNAVANITADGNVFSVRARVGGADATRFLIDEDGDLYSVTSAQTFDTYNDALLARAFDATTSPESIILSEWDEYVNYNEQDLIDAGILGAPIDEGGMWNVTQHIRLLNGGVWQNYQQIRNLERELISTRAAMAEMAIELGRQRLQIVEVN